MTTVRLLLATLLPTTALAAHPLEAPMGEALSAYEAEQYKTTVVSLRAVFQGAGPEDAHTEDARDRAVLALGLVYLELGKPEQAETFALQANASPDSWLALGRIDVEAGDGKGALKWLDQVPQDRRSPQWTALTCRAWALRGKPKKARAALEAPASADEGVYADVEWVLESWRDAEAAATRKAELDAEIAGKLEAWKASETPCAP